MMVTTHNIGIELGAPSIQFGGLDKEGKTIG